MSYQQGRPIFPLRRDVPQRTENPQTKNTMPFNDLIPMNVNPTPDLGRWSNIATAASQGSNYQMPNASSSFPDPTKSPYLNLATKLAGPNPPPKSKVNAKLYAEALARKSELGLDSPRSDALAALRAYSGTSSPPPMSASLNMGNQTLQRMLPQLQTTDNISTSEAPSWKETSISREKQQPFYVDERTRPLRSILKKGDNFLSPNLNSPSSNSSTSKTETTLHTSSSFTFENIDDEDEFLYGDSTENAANRITGTPVELPSKWNDQVQDSSALDDYEDDDDDIICIEDNNEKNDRNVSKSNLERNSSNIPPITLNIRKTLNKPKQSTEKSNDSRHPMSSVAKKTVTNSSKGPNKSVWKDQNLPPRRKKRDALELQMMKYFGNPGGRPEGEQDEKCNDVNSSKKLPVAKDKAVESSYPSSKSISSSKTSKPELSGVKEKAFSASVSSQSSSANFQQTVHHEETKKPVSLTFIPLTLRKVGPTLRPEKIFETDDDVKPTKTLVTGKEDIFADDSPRKENVANKLIPLKLNVEKSIGTKMKPMVVKKVELKTKAVEPVVQADSHTNKKPLEMTKSSKKEDTNIFHGRTIRKKGDKIIIESKGNQNLYRKVRTPPRHYSKEKPPGYGSSSKYCSSKKHVSEHDRVKYVPRSPRSRSRERIRSRYSPVPGSYERSARDVSRSARDVSRSARDVSRSARDVSRSPRISPYTSSRSRVSSRSPKRRHYEPKSSRGYSRSPEKSYRSTRSFYKNGSPYRSYRSPVHDRVSPMRWSRSQSPARYSNERSPVRWSVERTPSRERSKSPKASTREYSYRRSESPEPSYSQPKRYRDESSSERLLERSPKKPSIDRLSRTSSPDRSSFREVYEKTEKSLSAEGSKRSSTRYSRRDVYEKSHKRSSERSSSTDSSSRRSSLRRNANKKTKKIASPPPDNEFASCDNKEVQEMVIENQEPDDERPIDVYPENPIPSTAVVDVPTTKKNEFDATDFFKIISDLRTAQQSMPSTPPVSEISHIPAVHSPMVDTSMLPSSVALPTADSTSVPTSMYSHAMNYPTPPVVPVHQQYSMSGTFGNHPMPSYSHDFQHGYHQYPYMMPQSAQPSQYYNVPQYIQPSYIPPPSSVMSPEIIPPLSPLKGMKKIMEKRICSLKPVPVSDNISKTLTEIQPVSSVTPVESAESKPDSTSREFTSISPRNQPRDAVTITRLTERKTQLKAEVKTMNDHVRELYKSKEKGIRKRSQSKVDIDAEIYAGQQKLKRVLDEFNEAKQQLKQLLTKHGEVPSGKQDEVAKPRKEKEKVVKKLRYVECGSYWCDLCNEIFGTSSEMLAHMHNSDHHSLMDAESKHWPNPVEEHHEKGVEFIDVPLKGIQFIIPVKGFYCAVCKQCFPDQVIAEKHIKGSEHNTQYTKYSDEHPDLIQKFDSRRSRAVTLLEREKKRKTSEALKATKKKRDGYDKKLKQDEEVSKAQTEGVPKNDVENNDTVSKTVPKKVVPQIVKFDFADKAKKKVIEEKKAEKLAAQQPVVYIGKNLSMLSKKKNTNNKSKKQDPPPAEPMLTEEARKELELEPAVPLAKVKDKEEEKEPVKKSYNDKSKECSINKGEKEKIDQKTSQKSDTSKKKTEKQDGKGKGSDSAFYGPPLPPNFDDVPKVKKRKRTPKKKEFNADKEETRVTECDVKTSEAKRVKPNATVIFPLSEIMLPKELMAKKPIEVKSASPVIRHDQPKPVNKPLTEEEKDFLLLGINKMDMQPLAVPRPPPPLSFPSAQEETFITPNEPKGIVPCSMLRDALPPFPPPLQVPPPSIKVISPGLAVCKISPPAPAVSSILTVDAAEKTNISSVPLKTIVIQDGAAMNVIQTVGQPIPVQCRKKTLLPTPIIYNKNNLISIPMLSNTPPTPFVVNSNKGQPSPEVRDEKSPHRISPDKMPEKDNVIKTLTVQVSVNNKLTDVSVKPQTDVLTKDDISTDIADSACADGKVVPEDVTCEFRMALKSRNSAIKTQSASEAKADLELESSTNKTDKSCAEKNSDKPVPIAVQSKESEGIINLSTDEKDIETKTVDKLSKVASSETIPAKSINEESPITLPESNSDQPCPDVVVKSDQIELKTESRADLLNTEHGKVVHEDVTCEFRMALRSRNSATKTQSASEAKADLELESSTNKTDESCAEKNSDEPVSIAVQNKQSEGIINLSTDEKDIETKTVDKLSKVASSETIPAKSINEESPITLPESNSDQPCPDVVVKSDQIELKTESRADLLNTEHGKVVHEDVTCEFRMALRSRNSAIKTQSAPEAKADLELESSTNKTDESCADKNSDEPVPIAVQNKQSEGIINLSTDEKDIETKTVDKLSKVASSETIPAKSINEESSITLPESNSDQPCPDVILKSDQMELKTESRADLLNTEHGKVVHEDVTCEFRMALRSRNSATKTQSASEAKADLELESSTNKTDKSCAEKNSDEPVPIAVQNKQSEGIINLSTDEKDIETKTVDKLSTVASSETIPAKSINEESPITLPESNSDQPCPDIIVKSDPIELKTEFRADVMPDDPNCTLSQPINIPDIPAPESPVSGFRMTLRSRNAHVQSQHGPERTAVTKSSDKLASEDFENVPSTPLSKPNSSTQMVTCAVKKTTSKTKLMSSSPLETKVDDPQDLTCSEKLENLAKISEKGGDDSLSIFSLEKTDRVDVTDVDDNCVDMEIDDDDNSKGNEFSDTVTADQFCNEGKHQSNETQVSDITANADVDLDQKSHKSALDISAIEVATAIDTKLPTEASNVAPSLVAKIPENLQEMPCLEKAYVGTDTVSNNCSQSNTDDEKSKHVELESLTSIQCARDPENVKDSTLESAVIEPCLKLAQPETISNEVPMLDVKQTSNVPSENTDCKIALDLPLAMDNIVDQSKDVENEPLKETFETVCDKSFLETSLKDAAREPIEDYKKDTTETNIVNLNKDEYQNSDHSNESTIMKMLNIDENIGSPACPVLTAEIASEDMCDKEIPVKESNVLESQDSVKPQGLTANLTSVKASQKGSENSMPELTAMTGEEKETILENEEPTQLIQEELPLLSTSTFTVEENISTGSKMNVDSDNANKSLVTSVDCNMSKSTFDRTQESTSIQENTTEGISFDENCENKEADASSASSHTDCQSDQKKKKVLETSHNLNETLEAIQEAQSRISPVQTDPDSVEKMFSALVALTDKEFPPDESGSSVSEKLLGTMEEYVSSDMPVNHLMKSVEPSLSSSDSRTSADVLLTETKSAEKENEKTDPDASKQNDTASYIDSPPSSPEIVYQSIYKLPPRETIQVESSDDSCIEITSDDEIITSDSKVTLKVKEEPKDAVEEPKDAVEEPKDTVEESKNAVEELKDAVEEPKDVVEEPKDLVEEPKDAVEEPKDAVEEPKDAVEEPKDGVEEPKDAVEEPKNTVEEPKDAVDEPKDAIEEPKDTVEEPKATDPANADSQPAAPTIVKQEVEEKLSFQGAVQVKTEEKDETYESSGLQQACATSCLTVKTEKDPESEKHSQVLFKDSSFPVQGIKKEKNTSEGEGSVQIPVHEVKKETKPNDSDEDTDEYETID